MVFMFRIYKYTVFSILYINICNISSQSLHLQNLAKEEELNLPPYYVLRWTQSQANPCNIALKTKTAEFWLISIFFLSNEVIVNFVFVIICSHFCFFVYLAFDVLKII